MAETSISGIEFQIKGATGKAASSVDKLTNSLNGLKHSMQTSSTGKLKQNLEDVSKASKKAETTFGKLGRSIGRIAFYRAIRAAIRYITDSFKEGLENAYQFSKVVGYDLAATMDNLSTQSLKMKNQLGAAFGGLIMAIEPVLLQIIALITRAADALSQFTAMIAGKDTYLKAVDTVQEYGEAVGGVGQAAKEAMKYLAPFDELNRLPGDSGSSSGGGGAHTPDYSAMFEETPITATGLLGAISDAFGDVADWFEGQEWREIGNHAWDTLSSIFSDESKANEVVQQLFRTLGSVSGAVVGFTWGFIEGAVEDIMSTFKKNIRDYDGDSKIGITDVLTGIWNTAITPLVWIDDNIVKPFWRGFTGALFGAEKEPITVNDVLGWIFEHLSDQAIIGWVQEKAIPWFKEGIKDFGTEATLALTGMTPPDLKAWLTEGWQDFKTELYNIFIKPIVDTWNDFIANHPKIAKLLGLSQESGSAFPNNGETFSFDVEGTITDIKDSIPAEKKTLANFKANIATGIDNIKDKVSNAWKAVFGSKDSKAIDNSKIDTQANFISSTTSQNMVWGEAGRSIKMKADFIQNTTSGNMAWGKPERSIKMKADFIQNTTSGDMAWGKQYRSIKMKADFIQNTTSGNMAWGKSERSIKMNADFMAKTTSGNMTWGKDGRSIDMKSNFMSVSDSLTESQKTFDSKANFNTYTIDSEGTLNTGYGVWSYATAWFNDYSTAFDDTPTIDVTANVTSVQTTDGQDIRDLMAGLATGGVIKHGVFSKIPQYASGTSRAHGSLFVAGEAGPEVVGHIGGRTEVLNRSQLAATMFSAVSSALSGLQMRVTGMGNAPMTGAGDESMSEDVLYRAMLRALNDSDAFPDEIDLDGAVVYRKMVQRNRMERARTGVNPMLTY